MATSRRSFFRTTGAACAAVAQGAAAPVPELPKVRLGKHEITRLIIGSNPFYGYSHFNALYDRHMREWYTTDRVLSVLAACERNGIGTWQLHYSDRSIADLQKYNEQGGKMNWVLLGDGAMMTDLSLIAKTAKLGPIGIVHHGGWTDRRFRAGEMPKVREFLKAVRDSGVLAGISTHNPAVIDYVEGQNWDLDFYMTCLYRVTRTPEEIAKELGGEVPLGEPFFEKDPERMTRMIRQTKRTCLAFKLLAAGRAESVEKAFRFAYKNIKPGDAAIVGMYPRYTDEPQQNASLVRKILAG